jgi:hypothetical protein
VAIYHVFPNASSTPDPLLLGYKITPQYRLPYYWDLNPAKQEEFNRNIEALAKWIEGAIQRFHSGVKNSRVIELHNTCHYVFMVDEALVVREMRKFLLDEIRRPCVD